jgi:3D (Asp-Asp-Asp) domain-containing protein
MRVVVTSYNSEPGQTDSTPFITASGSRTRDGVVAANFLPFGTIVRFPEVFGDKEFVVEDRMNKRYYYRADIWMENKQDSIDFGAKYLEIEIL